MGVVGSVCETSHVGPWDAVPGGSTQPEVGPK